MNQLLSHKRAFRSTYNEALKISITIKHGQLCADDQPIHGPWLRKYVFSAFKQLRFWLSKNHHKDQLPSSS